MGVKGEKRKGGGLAVPGFGAGGMRTLCLTASLSGSMVGAELASAKLYDALVMVPRVGIAESVTDVSTLSEEVGHLELGPGLAGVARLLEAIRKLRLVVVVRAHLLKGVLQLGEVLQND